MQRRYRPIDSVGSDPATQAAQANMQSYMADANRLISQAFSKQQAQPTSTSTSQALAGYGNQDADIRTLLARTLQAEAGREGFQGMVDVGSVIRNRANAGGQYGDGIQGVIMRPGQFSAWNSVTGYAGGQQGQNMSFTPNEDAYRAADMILSGNYQDQTGGATHYVNYNISQPAWFNDSFVRRGNHWFGRAS